MLKHFQDSVATDINRIRNPWAKYSAWGAYWLAHGLALIAKWSLKLTLGLGYALTVGRVLNPPKKKKSKH